MHRNKKKEVDTEKGKLIYYDFRGFCDVRNNSFIDSKYIAFFRAYLVTVLKALVSIRLGV